VNENVELAGIFVVVMVNFAGPSGTKASAHATLSFQYDSNPVIYCSIPVGHDVSKFVLENIELIILDT
jgi:hypothetical protein